MMLSWNHEFGIFQAFADGHELISEQQLLTCNKMPRN